MYIKQLVEHHELSEFVQWLQSSKKALDWNLMNFLFVCTMIVSFGAHSPNLYSPHPDPLIIIHISFFFSIFKMFDTPQYVLDFCLSCNTIELRGRLVESRQFYKVIWFSFSILCLHVDESLCLFDIISNFLPELWHFS